MVCVKEAEQEGVLVKGQPPLINRCMDYKWVSLHRSGRVGGMSPKWKGLNRYGRHEWKHYLSTTSLADGNNFKAILYYYIIISTHLIIFQILFRR